MGHQILDITDLYICLFPELLPELCEGPTITLIFPPYRDKTLRSASHRGWLKPSKDSDHKAGPHTWPLDILNQKN